MEQTKFNTRKMVECAIMLALAYALSCISLYEMPMGGSVTPASMLPIMLIAIKYGTPTGLSVGFVYSLAQVAQALVKGNVFVYCEGVGIILLCLFFDYLVPFTVIGLAGLFRKTRAGEFYGIVLACVCRFVCHVVTGVVIWGQWAPEGMSAFGYSVAYNGTQMLPEMAICLVVAFFILNSTAVRKAAGLSLDNGSFDLFSKQINYKKWYQVLKNVPSILAFVCGLASFTWSIIDAFSHDGNKYGLMGLESPVTVVLVWWAIGAISAFIVWVVSATLLSPIVLVTDSVVEKNTHNQ